VRLYVALLAAKGASQGGDETTMIASVTAQAGRGHLYSHIGVVPAGGLASKRAAHFACTKQKCSESDLPPARFAGACASRVALLTAMSV
jgi:hypothetical protein